MGVLERWNSAISLWKPRLQDVASGVPKHVRQDVSNMFFLGDNVIATIRHGVQPSGAEPIIDIRLIVSPNAFASVALSAGVCFLAVQDVSIFDIPVAASAWEFAERLKRTKLVPCRLSTLTSMDGSVNAWEIIAGKALLLRFEPLSVGDREPQHSALTMASYSFNQLFTGKMLPLLSSIA